MTEITVALEESENEVDVFGVKDLVRVSLFLDIYPERFIVRITDSLGNTRFTKYCPGVRSSDFIWRIPLVSELGTWTVKIEEFENRLELGSAGFRVGSQRMLSARVKFPTVSLELRRSIQTAKEIPLLIGILEQKVSPEIKKAQNDFLKEILEPLTQPTSVSTLLIPQTTLSYKAQSVRAYFDVEPRKVPAAVPDIIPATEEKAPVQESTFFPGHSVQKEDYLRQCKLSQVSGIGSTYENRLRMIGITNVFEFVTESDTEKLADASQVRGARISGWQGAALALLENFKPGTVLSPVEVGTKDVSFLEGSEIEIISLKSLKGIGPSTAKKFSTIGIKTLKDLVTSSEKIGDISLETGFSIHKLNQWVQEASLRLGKEVKAPKTVVTPKKPITENEKLIKIKGIGQATAKKLNNAEIMTISEFLNQKDSLDEISMRTGISTKKLQQFLENALLL